VRPALIFLGFLAVAVPGCGASEAVSSCPPTFDSAAWKRVSNLDSDGEPVRRRLASQLERCGFLKSASKQRVRQLLGTPSPEIERGRSWHYYVGESGWGIDSDLLFIEFSRRNRVESVEVSQG